MPKVSVIMPTFNRAWVIERAIKSVLNQTFTDFELIIIDDCSSDNTKEILSKIKDPRINILTLEQNHGPAKARNKGLEKTSGEYIAYLDSDNAWYPTFLEVMLKELTPEYVLAYSAQNVFLVAGSRDNPEIIARKIRGVEYNPVKLMNENFIDVNATVHRKNILDQVGSFDETLEALEDWDLFTRIAIKHPFKIKYVQKVLGEYYSFLKETTVTVENANFSEDAIKEYFGISEGLFERGEVDKKILGKIKKLLQ